MELLLVLMNQQTYIPRSGLAPRSSTQTSSSPQVGTAAPMTRDVMLPDHPDIRVSDLFSADLQTPRGPSGEIDGSEGWCILPPI